jgi:hypothetical protein
MKGILALMALVMLFPSLAGAMTISDFWTQIHGSEVVKFQGVAVVPVSNGSLFGPEINLTFPRVGDLSIVGYNSKGDYFVFAGSIRRRP